MIGWLLKRFEEEGNENKAKEMAKYVKSKQLFYGIQAPARKLIFKSWKDEFDLYESWEDLIQLITRLWKGNSRDEMYFALLLIEGNRKYEARKVFDLLVSLIHSKNPHLWWDTLDWLSSLLSTTLLQCQDRPLLQQTIKTWTKREDFNMSS